MRDPQKVSARDMLLLLEQNDATFHLSEWIIEDMGKAYKDTLFVDKDVLRDGASRIYVWRLNNDNTDSVLFTVRKNSSYQFSRELYELINRVYFS